MIALPALQSLRKLSLSYGFLATSPIFFDHETKVMLKEISSKKGKTFSGNYQVNFFSTKIRDKTRHKTLVMTFLIFLREGGRTLEQWPNL